MVKEENISWTQYEHCVSAQSMTKQNNTVQYITFKVFLAYVDLWMTWEVGLLRDELDRVELLSQHGQTPRTYLQHQEKN